MKTTRKVYPPFAPYEEHLNLLGHGRPVWPESSLGERSIGDVGYMTSTGHFCPLFNLSLPSDHPINRKYGVPDNFEVPELSSSEIQQTSNYLKQGAIIASPGVIETEVGLRLAAIRWIHLSN